MKSIHFALLTMTRSMKLFQVPLVFPNLICQKIFDRRSITLVPKLGSAKISERPNKIKNTPTP